MSIGVGIFLIAAGAILAFGIRDSSSVVNLTVVGIVIMLAGAAGIWLSYHLTNQRRRVRNNAIDPAVEEEYRIVEDDRATPPTERDRETHIVSDSRTVADPGVAKGAGARQTGPEASPSERPVQGPEQRSDERTVELDPKASGLPTEPRRRARR